MYRSKSTVILKEYDSSVKGIEKFTLRIRDLLEQLLSESNINVHSITHRIKDRDSLKNKLNKPTANYSKLADITDISGIRIITYLPQYVGSISKIIEREFDVDVKNSIDKCRVLDPDRFGYLSVHYVVSLSRERIRLSEYKRYEGLQCEIQIRSILQHAWAEIQHDLGYKSPIDIPNEIKRRFFKLAGLLEIADDEFTRIHQDLDKYKESIKMKLNKTGEKILINNDSLGLYIKHSDILASIEKAISSNTGLEIAIMLPPDEISSLVNRLSFLNIQTIQNLDKLLNENKKIVIKLASTFLGPLEKNKKEGGFISTSISIFYLCYVLNAQQNNINLFKKYLIKHNNLSESSALETAERLIRLYNKLK